MNKIASCLVAFGTVVMLLPSIALASHNNGPSRAESGALIFAGTTQLGGAAYVEGTKGRIDHLYSWNSYGDTKYIRYNLSIEAVEAATGIAYYLAAGIFEWYLGNPQSDSRDCDETTNPNNQVQVCGSDNVRHYYFREWTDGQGFHRQLSNEIDYGENDNFF